MIFGQSGGGGKTSTLLGIPRRKGLFHRAAVQSGSGSSSGDAEAAARTAAIVIQELGLSKVQLEKIHTLPASVLVWVMPAVQRRLATPGGAVMSRMGGWGPILDGTNIPAHPFDPAAPAMSANVPLLVGTCLNEMVNGTDNPERETLTETELLQRVRERYKDNAGDIVSAFRKEYPRESPFGLWAAISAATQRRNAITQAERKAAQGAAPAYMYLYAWRTPMLGCHIGTFHSSEIAFVFDNASLCTNYSGGGPDALALSNKMGAAWAGFARTGKPGHSGLPPWPAYTNGSRATMVFNSSSSVRNHPEGEGLRLIGQASKSE